MSTRQGTIWVQAFEAIAARENETIEQTPVVAHTFSAAFERKTQKIIRAQNRWTWRFTKTRARRVWLAVALLILAFLLSLTVSAVRTRLFSYIVKDRGNGADLVNPEAGKTFGTLKEKYTLHKLPDGFEEADRLRATRWWLHNGNRMKSGFLCHKCPRIILLLLTRKTQNLPLLSIKT